MWTIRFRPSGFQRDGRVLDEVVAHRDDEVRAVEAGQDVVAGLEPDGHQRQVRPVVDRALAHERGRHRHVEALCQRAERVRRPAPQHAVPGEDERALGFVDEPGGVGDGLVGRLGEIRAAGDDRTDRVARLDGRSGDVLRELDVGRTGLLQGRDAERLADDLGDHRDALDPRVPLGDRTEHVDDVDDLVRLLVELVGGGLAGDGHDRRAVEVGVGDAGQQVRRAGPERRHRDGRAAGEPAVHVGHEGGALLVPGRDVADRARMRERLEDVQRLLARDREDVLATLRLETGDEEVGGGARGGRAHAAECTSERVTAR